MTPADRLAPDELANAIYTSLQGIGVNPGASNKLAMYATIKAAIIRHYDARVVSPTDPAAVTNPAEPSATRGAICMRCDGCGWYEGGKTIKTTCEVCSGTGVIAAPSPSHPAKWPDFKPLDSPSSITRPSNAPTMDCRDLYMTHYSEARAKGLIHEAAHEIGLFVVYLRGKSERGRFDGKAERAVDGLGPTDPDLRAALRDVINEFESQDSADKYGYFSSCNVCDGRGESMETSTITHKSDCVIGRARAALQDSRPNESPRVKKTLPSPEEISRRLADNSGAALKEKREPDRIEGELDIESLDPLTFAARCDQCGAKVVIHTTSRLPENRA